MTQVPAAAQNSKHESPAMTNAQRQAALRLKRKGVGKRQFNYWLTEQENNQVKDFLASGVAMQAAANLSSWAEQLAKEAQQIDDRWNELDGRITAFNLQQASLANTTATQGKYDLLKEKLAKSRLLNDGLNDDIGNYQNQLVEHERTIGNLKVQLMKAETALKGKPVKTFHVPDLPDRRAVITMAMSTDHLDNKEKPVHHLKTQTELAKKFSTEIKNTRSRLLSLVEIAFGTKFLEQAKSRHPFGGWQKFATPIISEAEKALLLESCVVLRNLESDVERAGKDVNKLHKQREAELRERMQQAGAALENSLFAGLDRRGEVMFVASMNMGNRGYGGWADLLDAASGKFTIYSESAADLFMKALKEERASLIRRMADTMQSTGQSAEKLAEGIVEKFRHPDTKEKCGNNVNLVTVLLVADRISKS